MIPSAACTLVPAAVNIPADMHRRTADLVLGLEHDDSPSGVRGRDRGRQPGAARTDDDDVPVILAAVADASMSSS